MIERYLALWGEEETQQFLAACENPIQTSIRINTLRNGQNLTVEQLEEKDVVLEQVPWLQTGYWADFRGFSPGALFEHMLGYYYVQGVPSMTVVKVLDPQPGETVIDLAAAPGGKTTHISQLMENNGIVIAIDQDRQRIRSLESNIWRCGAENTLVLRGDAKKLGTLDIPPDKILLDAPCSGEGLIPLDESRKTSKTMADIRYCATRQDVMLEAAIDALVEGGTIVYSTCSIAPEENELVIDPILRRHPELQVTEIDIEFGSPGYTTPYGLSLSDSLSLARRFLPHIDGTEGFFICKMTKEGRG
jgi:NOL1/NOP2/sun family putative RNA methylase